MINPDTLPSPWLPLTNLRNGACFVTEDGYLGVKDNERAVFNINFWPAVDRYPAGPDDETYSNESLVKEIGVIHLLEEIARLREQVAELEADHTIRGEIIKELLDKLKEEQ